MNLLIDIGNSRLKWAIACRRDMITGMPLANASLSEEQLAELWHSITMPDHVAISCVGNNTVYELVVHAANKRWPGIPIKRLCTESQAHGVQNAYSEPASLGIDRWLAMIAAFNKHQGAICIVDCGTAITIDIVAADGKHQGGLICPGLRLMKTALASGTAQLDANDTETSPSFDLTNNTGDAIKNGTLTAAVGFIQQALHNQDPDIQILVTGGDAEIIAGRLQRPIMIDPDLVLRGLALAMA